MSVCVVLCHHVWVGCYDSATWTCQGWPAPCPEELGAAGVAMGHLGQGDLKEQWLGKTQGGEKNTTWQKQTDNTNSLAGID